MTRPSYAELARKLAQARRLASEANDPLTQRRLIDLIKDLEAEIQVLLQFA
jgi:TATA-binding protein-associated factor Taf7